MTYRARLRIRLEKPLNISGNEHKIAVAKREVVLSAPQPEQSIADSNWLVFNTRGFSTEEEASDFGHRLRAALQVSSVATRLGVDVGRDVPTSGISSHVRDRIRQQTGTQVRDNVHGLDVFEDVPNVCIFSLSGTATVRANPDPLLADLDGLYGVAATHSARADDVLLLLNTALMQTSPVAQIVFAVSAVEMLGQDERWSQSQLALLNRLAQEAEAAPLEEAERVEVAEAIRRVHRLSLRQGVFRLMNRLGLDSLRRTWDELYAERSTLVHGLAPQPGKNYGDLAHRTMNLCGRVLLKALATEIPGAYRYVDRYY